ncbi:uncharacterized protein LOC143039707 [Oratosquilla oratoria]|uniref:uncharacterized protein LOC143039707 n=1 Tax=Oratosquilla oratoria TaxID=337810 RepID=UPI003F763D39
MWRSSKKEGGMEEGREEEEEEDVTKHKKDIFQETWMNECFDQVTFPNPACVKLMERVNRGLARRVEGTQDSELKQQALFLLLGRDFTEQHFPYHKYNVQALDPPRITSKQRAKYISEMKNFLNTALLKTLDDLDLPEDVTDYRGDDDLGHYLHEVRTTFREGLRKHTSIVLFEEEAKQQRLRQESYRGGDGDTDSEGDQDTDDEQEAARRKALRTLPRSTASDVAGRALVALVRQNPAKKESYVARLRERHLCLPTSLRQFLWWEFLESRETSRLRVKDDDANVLEIVKENFQKTLTKEIKSQKLSRAIRSNDWRTIDNAVIEAYDNSSALRNLDTEEHMIQTARALNVLHVHSKRFNVPQIFWLLPIQSVYRQKNSEGDEEYVLRLAIYLELVTRHCQFDQREVFQLTESVVDEVRSRDPEYLDHVARCLTTQISRINLKDFPPEVLLKDPKSSQKLYAELQKKGTKKLKAKYEKIFTDPAIFVRKWIAQGFVGVLSVTGGLWAWDQLMLSSWSRDTVRRIAVAILSLIRPWMMRAHMYSGARKVFLDEPGKLYTSDLQTALQHLATGGAYKDLPDNKNFLSPTPKPKDPPPPPPLPPPPPPPQPPLRGKLKNIEEEKKTDGRSRSPEVSSEPTYSSRPPGENGWTKQDYEDAGGGVREGNNDDDAGTGSVSVNGEGKENGDRGNGGEMNGETRGGKEKSDGENNNREDGDDNKWKDDGENK